MPKATTFQHGFVVGKFMPLHNGHVFLLNTARNQCQQLTILLFSQPHDVISGETRLSWLQQLYPDCQIIHHTKVLPRDETGYENWDVWLSAIKQCCNDTYDVVFSSEAYGKRLAKDFNAQHVVVDHVRQTVPITGTTIRSNPQAYLQYLPAIVREYYENQN